MQYEYKIIIPKTSGFFTKKPAEAAETELNELGSQGWELVAVVPLQGASARTYGGATNGFAYHFKRLITDLNR